MASVALLGLAVTGGVILMAKASETYVEFDSDADPAVDVKKKHLNNQREWGYIPSVNQPPTNAQNWNRTVVRFRKEHGPLDPESVGDVYAAAYGQKCKELAAQAFNQTDHSIVVPHGKTRLPLFIPLSSQGTGDMQSYPLSYFEANSNQDPIETRQDIFRDPLPSTFPGPARDIYPPAVAPDRLRNPWLPDGRFARELQQSRRPAIATRPKKDTSKPAFYPRAPHPWARKLAAEAKSL